MLAPWKKSYDKPRQHTQKQRHHFADNVPYSQSYGFSSSHILELGELDHKEGWMLKNWYFWTLVLVKTLENPLDSKEIKPISPKENQSWIVTGRTDVESEAPILWPPDTKNLLIGRDPYASKDLGQEKKGAIDQEMVWWHHWSMDMSLSKLWETVKYREAWHAAVHEVTKSWTWLSD